MSLWLQSAIEHLNCRRYKAFRDNLLPIAPILIPGCMIRELEFGERCCTDPADDPLFPIRFLWLLEGNEQRQFNLPMLGRSRYHPEILLFEIWDRAVNEPKFRDEMESEGFRFNWTEKAIAMSTGWILIGNHFVEDLFQIESLLYEELLFPDNKTGEMCTVFQSFRKQK
jgi:hypothetical protein